MKQKKSTWNIVLMKQDKNWETRTKKLWQSRNNIQRSFDEAIDLKNFHKTNVWKFHEINCLQDHINGWTQHKYTDKYKGNTWINTTKFSWVNTTQIHEWIPYKPSVAWPVPGCYLRGLSASRQDSQKPSTLQIQSN